MKLLLDTHIILWALDDNPKLPKQAKALIMDVQNSIYYSSASVWETTIKYMSKPDKIRISGSKLSELCRKMGYQMLPITDKHITALETLIFHNEHQMHNDPFDRIMIAQAKAEDMKFITHDSKMPFYNESCVIVV
ncbi:MAG: type II toxin-antitoxin system VapC family toxin [Bacteroidales bacterium]|nr:type II toxin-antitoxin system VapC family toxin [Lachnoclostridium sp.]MCM1384910.1 type II toxin-antitoxin system VapC family toxin [Lachnoclostridium sp.]MCM1465620.1 type II toxin-antitoxin system VapC family toxin [Bacteroidales bacterium]